jgi:hypothetical protein
MLCYGFWKICLLALNSLIFICFSKIFIKLHLHVWNRMCIHRIGMALYELCRGKQRCLPCLLSLRVLVESLFTVYAAASANVVVFVNGFITRTKKKHHHRDIVIYRIIYHWIRDNMHKSVLIQKCLLLPSLYKYTCTS